MRILLTNHELARRTGTELVTAELALALRGRGHEVAVFTWCRGDLAGEVEAAGVPVVEDPREVPFVPEALHGQHHLAVMAALAAWPGLGGLFYCHGVLPFDEQPPRHPRLLRYLSMAGINAGWVAEAAGVPPDQVGVLPNWFDESRFRTVRDPARATARAVVFGNRIGPGPVFDAVKAGCARHGMELTGIGRPFGNATEAPEHALPEYDVVFATGRSALEALACGCAVVPLDAVAGLGRLVTPEDFDEQRDRNWCVYQRPIEVAEEVVAAELARWSASAQAAVTRRVREELTLVHAVTALEGEYRALAARAAAGAAGPVIDDGERAALVGYFRFLAARTRESDAAFREARRYARLAEKVPVLKEEAAAARRDLKSLVRRLEDRWWGRRFLRRHGGWQNPGAD